MHFRELQVMGQRLPLSIMTLWPVILRRPLQLCDALALLSLPSPLFAQHIPSSFCLIHLSFLKWSFWGYILPLCSTNAVVIWFIRPYIFDTLNKLFEVMFCTFLLDLSLENSSCPGYTGSCIKRYFPRILMYFMFKVRWFYLYRVNACLNWLV